MSQEPKDSTGADSRAARGIGDLKGQVAVITGSTSGIGLALARAVAALPQLKLRGLMSIPEIAPDFEAARAVHAGARALFDQVNADGLGLDTLSMGMSDDFAQAVAYGATMVRIGTALFGARPAK